MPVNLRYAREVRELSKVPRALIINDESRAAVSANRGRSSDDPR